MDFGSRLAECLSTFGRVETVHKANAADKTSHWDYRIEKENDFVVYIADTRSTNWTRLCLRQAQTTLLLTNRDEEATPWRVLGESSQSRRSAPANSCCSTWKDHADGSARWLDLYHDAITRFGIPETWLGSHAC